MTQHDEQRAKILSLLQTAEMLSKDLEERLLTYLIERAIDECQATFIHPSEQGQAPYTPG